MNVKRLEEIARWLEAGAPHMNDDEEYPVPGHKGATAFNMNQWLRRNDCGTTCCIAGAAVQFNTKAREDYFKSKESLEWPRTPIEKVAAELLGIPEKCAEKLFYARQDSNSETSYVEKMTPAWAARCIRNFIATGKIDWEGTRNA